MTRNRVLFQSDRACSEYVVGALYRISAIDCGGDESDVYMCCCVYEEHPVMVNLRTGYSHNDHGDPVDPGDFYRVHGTVSITG